MRITLMVIGLILLVGGIWVVAGHGAYTSDETIAQLGQHAFKVTQEKTIPTWAGYAGIAVGAVLTLAGLLRGKR
jgi:hypothetical protein